MKKLFSLLLSILVLFGSFIVPVSADTSQEPLKLTLGSNILTTDFSSEDIYYTYEATESNEIANIYDEKTGEILGSFELNYSNPLSRAQSTGAYKKYLANGLTLVHSFAFNYTGSGTSKIVTSIVWDTVSVDGWSIFSFNSATHSAYKASSGSVGGTYSVNIKATITGSLTVTGEYENTLKKLGFGGNISIGSTYSGSKTFYGDWTLSVNSSPGCTTSICPTSLLISN